MGTQKNRLTETVLLSTQSKCSNDRSIRKYSQFYVHFFAKGSTGFSMKRLIISVNHLEKILT